MQIIIIIIYVNENNLYIVLLIFSCVNVDNIIRKYICKQLLYYFVYWCLSYRNIY